jgi:L-asparagine oxygenase
MQNVEQADRHLCELPVNFAFTDSDRDRLAGRLMTIEPNPYREYERFTAAVQEFVGSGGVSGRFQEFADDVGGWSRMARPFVLMKNCPIDRDVPVFDFDAPVESKHMLKQTFIAEAFLALYAQLVGTPPIGYLNVNDGDVFQDIYPKAAMRDSQSQKALGEIRFHKDLANHFVRPDYVNMLSMRADPRNGVYTCFVSNREALARLSSMTVETLREVEFHTPYDDLTVAQTNVELEEAPPHPVLSDDVDLRFFEGRTVGLTARAELAIAELTETLHALKARVLLMPGDFLSEHNNFSIHCKEIVHVHDEDALKTRWIIKTVNVDDLTSHQQHFLPDRHAIVNG